MTHLLWNILPNLPRSPQNIQHQRLRGHEERRGLGEPEAYLEVVDCLEALLVGGEEEVVVF